MGFMFWLVLTFIFIVLEISIPSLITIWFALAAGFTVVVALICESMNVEVIIFTFLSIFFILFTRPYAKKFLSRNKENFVSSMIGSKVRIVKVIDNEIEEKIYEVKFKGSIWTAISYDEFLENDIASIQEFKGNRIILKK